VPLSDWIAQPNFLFSTFVTVLWQPLAPWVEIAQGDTCNILKERPKSVDAHISNCTRRARLKTITTELKHTHIYATETHTAALIIQFARRAMEKVKNLNQHIPHSDRTRER
jgi:hypothetical protein